MRECHITDLISLHDHFSKVQTELYKKGYKKGDHFRLTFVRDDNQMFLINGMSSGLYTIKSANPSEYQASVLISVGTDQLTTLLDGEEKLVYYKLSGKYPTGFFVKVTL